MKKAGNIYKKNNWIDMTPIGGVYIPHTFTARQQYLNLHVDISD